LQKGTNTKKAQTSPYSRSGLALPTYIIRWSLHLWGACSNDVWFAL